MIIFIEDRELVASSFETRFQRVGETLVHFNAEEAVEWLSSSSKSVLGSVEAVLLGQCGCALEVMERVRRYLEVPVVALLDNRNLQQLLGLYNAGADDVVTKPVHCDELIVRFAAIKKRVLSTDIAAQSKAAITVFMDGRDPVINGQTLALPRRERRILEYLASLNGRRASRSQVFNAIYGVLEDDIEESVVESHISKLRKKLRDVLDQDPINSMRFLGYQLDPAFLTASLEMTSKGNFMHAKGGSLAQGSRHKVELQPLLTGERV